MHTALALADRYRNLGARELVHLAVCRRHSVRDIKTFDRSLASTFDH